MTAPKEIDRDDVLGELQHRWYGDGDPLDMIRWTLDELVELDILRYREPADDPSKSPIGEVRRSSTAAVTVIKVGDTVATRWQAVETDASLGNEFVAGWEVIGAVPGTPAAEQNPVPPPVLARVRELLTNGQRIRAIKAIREAAVGLGLKEAKAFAETLPEWAVAERVNNERLRDAVLGEEVHVPADPHVPVVLKRADTAPRTFRSDGPEPPSDVTCVEWLRETRSTANFLQRHKDGWAWVLRPGGEPVFSDTPLHWCPARGEFREVLS